jgi:phosphoribosylanthranilate isomerase
MQRKCVKICGLTTVDAVRLCSDTGCGYAGFIAVPTSPRYVTYEQMAVLTSLLASTTQSVLVTVDATDALLETYISTTKPDMLQLHGSETPERCTQLAQRFGLPIIKAIGIATATDIATATAYQDVVDMLLLDTKLPGGASGGTGIAFDWSWLHGVTFPIPWFLSGGIGEHNVADAMRQLHPPLLDVSSALESSPGIKDTNKINSFMQQIDGL